MAGIRITDLVETTTIQNPDNAHLIVVTDGDTKRLTYNTLVADLSAHAKGSVTTEFNELVAEVDRIKDYVRDNYDAAFQNMSNLCASISGTMDSLSSSMDSKIAEAQSKLDEVNQLFGEVTSEIANLETAIEAIKNTDEEAILDKIAALREVNLESLITLKNNYIALIEIIGSDEGSGLRSKINELSVLLETIQGQTVELDSDIVDRLYSVIAGNLTQNDITEIKGEVQKLVDERIDIEIDQQNIQDKIESQLGSIKDEYVQTSTEEIENNVNEALTEGFLNITSQLYSWINEETRDAFVEDPLVMNSGEIYSAADVVKQIQSGAEEINVPAIDKVEVSMLTVPPNITNGYVVTPKDTYLNGGTLEYNFKTICQTKTMIYINKNRILKDENTYVVLNIRNENGSNQFTYRFKNLKDNSIDINDIDDGDFVLAFCGDIPEGYSISLNAYRNGDDGMDVKLRGSSSDLSASLSNYVDLDSAFVKFVTFKSSGVERWQVYYILGNAADWAAVDSGTEPTGINRYIESEGTPRLIAQDPNFAEDEEESEDEEDEENEETEEENSEDITKTTYIETSDRVIYSEENPDSPHVVKVLVRTADVNFEPDEPYVLSHIDEINAMAESQIGEEWRYVLDKDVNEQNGSEEIPTGDEGGGDEGGDESDPEADEIMEENEMRVLKKTYNLHPFQETINVYLARDHYLSTETDSTMFTIMSALNYGSEEDQAAAALSAVRQFEGWGEEQLEEPGTGNATNWYRICNKYPDEPYGHGFFQDGVGNLTLDTTLTGLVTAPSYIEGANKVTTELSVLEMVKNLYTPGVLPLYTITGIQVTRKEFEVPGFTKKTYLWFPKFVGRLVTEEDPTIEEEIEFEPPSS